MIHTHRAQLKCLNDPIARLANAEGKCTGDLRETCFTFQPQLTEEAPRSCMAYVGLNPIRAGKAKPGNIREHPIRQPINPVITLASPIKPNRSMSEVSTSFGECLFSPDTFSPDTQYRSENCSGGLAIGNIPKVFDDYACAYCGFTAKPLEVEIP
ncbi:hypothetical protein [Pseudomaricurvus hydrocarbonicus]|uniref:hypothetical protein n=1 Tax=Pseudomaricurvus hydrocarbonicus TaxID=1470433 RepID=UPI00141D9F5A|nr:hypothetical protein [Aestuariicella hydrocarbonica]